MKLVILQIIYGVAVLTAAFFVFFLLNQGAHARKALCALEGDFRDRITTTQKFVDEHGGVNGQAIQGVSNKVLLQNTASQKRTANVLDHELNCSK